jgi:hypothetical protein
MRWAINNTGGEVASIYALMDVKTVKYLDYSLFMAFKHLALSVVRNPLV